MVKMLKKIFHFNEFKLLSMSFFYFLEPLKEFVNLDNNLTDHLLSLQAKAVELGLLAQKFEDEGNAYYVLSQTGVRTIIFLLSQFKGYFIMVLTNELLFELLYICISFSRLCLR